VALCLCSRQHPTEACQNATNLALSYLPTSLDPYDVYAPVCRDHSGAGDARVQSYTPFLGALRAKYGLDIQYNPCLANYVAPYLNLPEVQAAIHARPTDWTPGGGIVYGDTRWASVIGRLIVYVCIRWACSHHPGESEGSAFCLTRRSARGSENIVPYFERFFKEAPSWRILVFSGDTDAAVPFIGTQRWIECMGQPVKQDWKHWWSNDQVCDDSKHSRSVRW
jgi:hypothetical protein